VRDCAELALPGDIAEWPADAREHFEERAAIMEYDGGLPRVEAERLAEAEVRMAKAAIASPPAAGALEGCAQPLLAGADRTAETPVRREGGRPNAVCLSCYGTRFVRLRNGRRSVCFVCEQPAQSEIEGEDAGVVGGVA